MTKQIFIHYFINLKILKVMRKYNLFALLLLSIFIFSCSKNEDSTVPNNVSRQASQQNLTDAKSLSRGLPELNEKNSKKLTWDQLPAQLRNAKRLQNLQQLPKKAVANATTSSISYQYAYGYWGGTGGSSFAIYPTIAGSRIIAMAVRSGAYVDAITVWYMDPWGNVYYGGSAGGSGGDFYLAFFDADEYIYAVGGRSGQYVDHLYIWTNKKTLSYGGYGGYYFQYVLPSSYYQVLGFWGGSGSYIDRIGFYMYSRW
jgi:hypothetical protein